MNKKEREERREAINRILDLMDEHGLAPDRLQAYFKFTVKGEIPAKVRKLVHAGAMEGRKRGEFAVMADTNGGYGEVTFELAFQPKDVTIGPVAETV